MSQYSALSTDEQSSAGGHACDADKLQALKAELQHERRRTAELRAELGVSRHAREGHQVPAEGGTLAFDERTGSAGHRNGGDGSDSDTGSGRQEDGAREPRASPPVATGQARDVSLELSAAAGEGDPGSGQTASQQSVLRSQCREGSRLHCCMNMARDFLGDGQPGPSLEAENRPQQIVTELSGHLDRVKYACFFDGGTKAVSCADDNTLRVWDLVSSCCIGVLGVPKVQGEPSGVDDVEALATSEVEAEEGSPKPRQGSGVDYNSAYVDVNRRLQSVLEVKSCGPFDLRETKIPELQWGERKYSLHGRTGKLSGEPVEVSLGRIQRRARGIPDSATHFIYAYQADDGPAAEEGSKVGAEDEALLALGGFIYLQKTGDPWKAVHALGIETRPGASKLHFRKSPHYLKAAWLREKMTARQFRKVNILALNKQGAHWYCWVSPGEDIWQDGAVSDTHGGFVYLSDRLDLEAASNDKDIDELSKSHSDSCYFEMASGHWHWVRSCRALKDNKSILSCSADGTLRMWDIPTGRCELIMTGHKDWVMECDIFDDESRVVSCSSDKTLRVWNLIDGSEQKHMTGHKEWVMCCSAYRHREGWRAVSSSRDTTLGVWSLDSGSDWLYWLKGHTDWVGCCRVFEHADGWKALSCSNDKELRVWNLSSCESKRDPEQQISHESGQQDESELVLKGHKDIAIGCDAFSIDGKWQAVSCSADNSIHFWNLSSEDTDIAGANGQSVRKPLRTFSTAHRVRGVCVTTDGTKILSCSADHKVRLWDLELLRDKEGLVAQLDETVESEVWHNEGRKMMWRLWPHMAVNRHRLWTFRLLQGIHSISSMELETLLYERDANGKTFIHQLASTEDGGFVLAKLLESYQDERQHARDGTEATESLLRRSQAEATMGLMRRSTTYASEEKTVLKTALEQGNKIMIQTLLDDHCLAVAAIKRQDHYLQQTDLRPRYRDCFKALRSVELADVFDKFPDLAFRFLNELKLPHSYNHYIAVDELSESFVEQLPKDLREKIQTVQKKEAPNQLAIECSPVPLVFVKVKPQEECCGAMTFLDKYITTGRGQRTYLPFSKLLESAVEYVEANMAEQEDVVDLFNAPVLQVIIQHKWHTCGSIFSTQIVGYVIYIVALTVILLYNGRIELGQARCADHDGFACPLVPLAVPICIVYTVLLWKWEVS
jgi:WD40 repeat protein